MRENWSRAAELLRLSNDDLQSLFEPVFADARVTESIVSEGGLANTNLRVALDGHEHPYLLRLYNRDALQAKKESALNRLVSKTVPSPRFIYFAESNPITGGPYVIMDWIAGERLETILGRLSDSELKEAGESVGRALCAIHSYKFEQAGFFDSELSVADQIEINGNGLIEYVKGNLDGSLARERAGEDCAKRLIDFVEAEAGLLDEWKGGACLTHADFGGSNILMSRTSGAWRVAAVLDWEFAFSGTPFFDFGNLLREPVGSVASFVEALAQSYRRSGGELPSDWRKMSLLTDLTAWVEFLTRPTVNQALIDDARRIIHATIDGW